MFSVAKCCAFFFLNKHILYCFYLIYWNTQTVILKSNLFLKEHFKKFFLLEMNYWNVLTAYPKNNFSKNVFSPLLLFRKSGKIQTIVVDVTLSSVMPKNFWLYLGIKVSPWPTHSNELFGCTSITRRFERVCCGRVPANLTP